MGLMAQRGKAPAERGQPPQIPSAIMTASRLTLVPALQSLGTSLPQAGVPWSQTGLRRSPDLGRRTAPGPTPTAAQPAHQRPQHSVCRRPWFVSLASKPLLAKKKKKKNQPFPGGSEDKASARNAGDPGLVPGLGRSPGEGNGNPLQYSCLENPMDRGARWATVHGVPKSRT